jgi:hypothetical protein
VLGGKQQGISRKGTKHTKKSFKLSLLEMPFLDIAEKNFVAFECFVGNNKAFPAKAQSTQRKGSSFRCRNAFPRHHRKTLCAL